MGSNPSIPTNFMSLTDYAAREAGVEISRTEFPSLYYPIPFDNYVVACVSGDTPSRGYSHFNKVFELLNMELSFNGIKIIQIGGEKDYKIRGAYDLCGALSLRQAAHVIEKSKLFVGCDHIFARIAASANVPVAIAVSVTTSSDITPWNANRFDVIESDRGGLKPSYSLEENPKTIDLIFPEAISAKIADALSIKWKNSFKTVRIGKSFYEERIDFIPDFPVNEGTLNNRKLVCRYDLSPNAAALFQFYHFYGGPLFTDRPVSPKLFEQFGGKIPHTVYFIDGEYSADFVKFLHSLPRPYDLVSNKTGKELEEIKLELFDYNQIKSISRPDYSEVKAGHLFATNRLFLSHGQFFPSIPHWRKGIGMSNSMKIIDPNDAELWDNYENFYIYE